MILCFCSVRKNIMLMCQKEAGYQEVLISSFIMIPVQNKKTYIYISKVSSMGYKYIAFISYKREDEEWAARLQRKLEEFILPVQIREEHPGLPENLRPVFRDKTDLGLGLLERRIKEGLMDSRFLIVVCSPNSASSKWVGKEVQEFIDEGRSEMIIPYIISGTPNSGGPDECFPSPLKSLNGSQELLAANVNEISEDYAIAKIMARMLDLRIDTLWNRYEKDLQMKLLQRKEEQARLAAFQSSLFIEQAERMAEAGETIKARELAMMAVPDRDLEPDKQVSIKAEHALRNAAIVDSGTVNLEYNDPLGDFQCCCYQSDYLFVLSSKGIRKLCKTSLKEIRALSEIAAESQEHPDILQDIFGCTKEISGATCIAPHHDGKTLFVSIRSDVYHTDITLNEITGPIYKGEDHIKSLSVRPGMNELAVLDDKNRITVLDLDSRQVKNSFSVGRVRHLNRFSFPSNPITSLEYSPDGSSMILCLGFEKIMAISSDDGHRISKRSWSGVCQARNLGDSGNAIICKHSTSGLSVYGPNAEFVYSVAVPSTSSPEFLAVDKSGTHCAVICRDRHDQVIQIGLIHTGNLPRPEFDYLKLSPKLMLSGRNFEVSKDARFIVFRESNKLFDLKTNQTISFKFMIDFADFSYDNKYLLVGNRDAVYVVNLETYETLSNERGRNNAGIMYATFAIGTHDVVLSYDEEENGRWRIMRGDAESGKESLLGFSSILPVQIRYGDGDRYTAIVNDSITDYSHDKTAEIIELETGDSMSRIRIDGQVLCTGSASGEILICTKSTQLDNSVNAIHVFNINRGECATIEDIREPIKCGQFSNTGNYLVLSSEKRLFLISTGSNAVIMDLPLENDGVAVAFNEEDSEMTVFALSTVDSVVYFSVPLEDIDTICDRIRGEINIKNQFEDANIQ